MIIKRKVAENMDNNKLAEIATSYANAFARALGRDEHIEVEPGIVLYKPDEVEAAYRKQFESIAKVCYIGKGFDEWYKKKKDHVDNRIAFFNMNIIYVPLTELEGNEKNLVLGKVGQELGEKYVSLKGLGAEMGHLAAYELYGPKTFAHAGLGEILDTLSRIHEVSVNAVEVGGLPPQIEECFVTEIIKERRWEMEITKTLLFSGDDAARRKLSESCNDSEIEKLLLAFKKDYAYQRHFDGDEIFFGASRKAGADLKSICGIVDELLSNPTIRTVVDALRALDWSEEKLRKYGDVFTNDNFLRAEIMGLPSD